MDTTADAYLYAGVRIRNLRPSTSAPPGSGGGTNLELFEEAAG